MILANHQAVTQGRVTQLRRLLQPYPTRLPDRGAPVIGKGQPAPARWPRAHRYGDRVWRPCPVEVGDTVTVQPPRGEQLPEGQPPARVTITEVRVCAAGEITFDDAQAEGHRAPIDMKRAWIHRHDQRWLDQVDALLGFTLPITETALLALEPVEQRTLRRQLAALEQAGAIMLDDLGEQWAAVDGAMDAAILHRFATRHAHRPVWVITFQLEHDREDRWLREGAGVEGMVDGDYTRSPGEAMRDEPPAVDAATLARFSAEAEFVSHMRRAANLAEVQAAREVLSLHERLRELETRPAGADVTRELRAIRRRLEQAEKRSNRGSGVQVTVRQDAA